MSEPGAGSEPAPPPSRPAPAPGEPPFPPPPRRPQRNWIVPVAVLGFVFLVVIVGVILLESALAGLRDDYAGATEPPLYTPAPTPTSTEFSITCASGCLTVDSARALIPDASLQKALDSRTDVVDADPGPPTTAALEHERDVGYSHEQATDADCFFLGSRSPVAVTPDSADAQSLDPVSLLLSNDILGGNTTMTQTVRYFTTPEAATQYEQQVQAQVALCQSRNPRMGPSDPLDTPPSVTSLAFTDPEDRATTYVYDFRRANAVVRFRVTSTEPGNEDTVRRALTIWAADDLAQLELN